MISSKKEESMKTTAHLLTLTLDIIERNLQYQASLLMHGFRVPRHTWL